MLDQLYQIIENNLKQFEVEVELKLNIKEAERALNNFIKTINDDFTKVYRTTDDWMRSLETSLANVQTYT